MRILKVNILCLLMLSLTIPAWAGSYQYISAADVKQKLTDHAPLVLVDIQVEEEYASHHLPGAISTFAYPVKSDADRKKLDPAVALVQSSADPVVIVCPRGGGGAKRAYDYLANQGVPGARLFILEQGQQGWPYPELLATAK